MASKRESAHIGCMGWIRENFRHFVFGIVSASLVLAVLYLFSHIIYFSLDPNSASEISFDRFWTIVSSLSGWFGAFVGLLAAFFVWVQVSEIRKQNSDFFVQFAHTRDIIAAKNISMLQKDRTTAYSGIQLQFFLKKIQSKDKHILSHEVERFIECYQNFKNFIAFPENEVIYALGIEGMKETSEIRDRLLYYFNLYYENFGENVRVWFEIYNFDKPDEVDKFYFHLNNIRKISFEEKYCEKYGKNITEDVLNYMDIVFSYAQKYSQEQKMILNFIRKKSEQNTKSKRI
nr:hypothetical protein [uncultured Cohaesibacter sp.]